jgi:hypothetical protein
MAPVIRTVHERFDVLREKLCTTLAGDVWAGCSPTFELTDCNGQLSGEVDGA